MGSAGTKRQISERDTNGRFGPFTQNLHGELGSKVAASLGTPHGASPAPGWEAGDALVARARSPTLPERAYFASSSRRRPSFAPMPSYSDGVARLLVQLIQLGERPRLVRSDSVHHTPIPAVGAGATAAVVRTPSEQQISPQKVWSLAGVCSTLKDMSRRCDKCYSVAARPVAPRPPRPAPSACSGKY